MKSILCYGDSNTWGYVPGTYETRDRYNRDTRWTGRLQQLLGTSNYYVIEEGLNGRTTNVMYKDKTAGFCGTSFFAEILYTHAPLDLVIIMLGINDMKNEFGNRTSEDIAKGIRDLIEIAHSTNYGPGMQEPPPLLIVSTPLPVETTDQNTNFPPDAGTRFGDLANQLQQIVSQYKKGVYLFDAAPHIQLSSIDAIHFDQKAHQQFAILMNETVQKIFGNN